MDTVTSNRLLDVRALPSTREILAYADGGLFPVLALAPDGAVIAVVRGGAGHLGRSGRIEIIRSVDGGFTWTPPSVIADSDWDDRNPALGVSRAGTLILAYHRQGYYDDQGNYRVDPSRTDRPVEVMVTRSFDVGLTWERPRPLGLDLFRTDCAFGKIVSLSDGTLLLPIYGAAHPPLMGTKACELPPNASCSYLLRSRDDGQTWGDPALIAVDVNETALTVLPGGELLAAMRAEVPRAGLRISRSPDGGQTWSEPVQLTGRRQAPGDWLLLSSGDLLLAYGNRNPPYRIEGLISRDRGRSWLDCLLTFSGHLYGYNVDAPRPFDFGYPSSVIHEIGGVRTGVTMYYHNPSINQPDTWKDDGEGVRYLPREGEARYDSRDYRAVAVIWRENELIDALDRVVSPR